MAAPVLASPKVTVPVPSEPMWRTLMRPLLMVAPPEKVFATVPAMVSVPVPVLTIEPKPARTFAEELVNVMLIALLLTVTKVGVTAPAKAMLLWASVAVSSIVTTSP